MHYFQSRALKRRSKSGLRRHLGCTRGLLLLQQLTSTRWIQATRPQVHKVNSSPSSLEQQVTGRRGPHALALLTHRRKPKFTIPVLVLLGAISHATVASVAMRFTARINEEKKPGEMDPQTLKPSFLKPWGLVHQNQVVRQ